MIDLRASIFPLFLTVTLLSACGAQDCGDVNRSGLLDVTDALLTARFGAGLVALDGEQRQLADVNGSGSADVLDALRIASEVVGLSGPALACPQMQWQDVGNGLGQFPVQRCEQHSCDDFSRNRMIMYGGQLPLPSGGYQTYRDTWMFDYATRTWTELTVPGYTPNPIGQLVYDAARDRVLHIVNENVSALDAGSFGAWVPLSPTGSVGGGCYGMAGYDPASGGVVRYGSPLSGGCAQTGCYFLDFTTSTHGVWRALTQLGALPVESALNFATLHDQNRLLVNARNSSGETVIYDVLVDAAAGTVTWDRLQPSGTAPLTHPNPSPREPAYDAAHDRLFLTNGSFDNGAVTYLDLAGGGDGAWVTTTVPGVVPEIRRAATAGADATGALVIYGGGGSLGMLDDTWRLQLP